MKKLTYLLMALCLIFFVSCNPSEPSAPANSSNKSSEQGGTATDFKSDNPAVEEWLNYYKTSTERVKKCTSCSELADVDNLVYSEEELLEEKWGDVAKEPTDKEAEQLSQAKRKLDNAFEEQYRKLGCDY
jgi:hypothetical protein